MAFFNKIQLTTKWFSTREENVNFDFQSRCICGLYGRLLRKEKVSLPSGWGIVVEYSPAHMNMSCNIVEGLYKLGLGNDIRDFALLDDSGKKRYTLDLIKDTIAHVSELFSIDSAPFEQAAERVVAVSYINSWVWKKGRKRSPDRKFMTNITVFHEVSHFDIRVDILDVRSKPVCGGIVASDNKPDEIIIDGFLGELLWLDDDQLVLNSKLINGKPIFFRKSDLMTI